MHVIEIAEARLHLNHNGRTEWSIQKHDAVSALITDRKGNPVAIIIKDTIGKTPSYIINTRRGGIWHRNTLLSALDAVLDENRRAR